MPTVRVPSPLRSQVGGDLQVVVDGVTVGEAIDDLVRRHAGLRDRLLDDDGSPAQWVNVFVGSTDVRTLDGLATTLRPADVVTLVPAVAGG